MRSQFCFLSITCLLLGCGCSAQTTEPETVAYVNIDRYLGTWFEIARYPNRFQKECFCASAEYTLNTVGTIGVTNRCKKGHPGGSEKSITGKAFVVPNSGNAKLKVRFFWPFRAPYWIVALDDDYQWAVVSGPSRKYLWILARKPQLDDSTRETILLQMTNKGFATDKLLFSSNGCVE